jgi:exodeoxyribonuclease VII large subunit
MPGFESGEDVGRPGQRLVWSVGALVHAVSDSLSARFSSCTVKGEISGFSRAASGHAYFCLKDAEGDTATIRCAMFRRVAAMLDFRPDEGRLVQLRGRLAVYEPRGELQFIVESMQQAGAGALFEQFLRLKAKLEAEGVFDPLRKRPLPAHPRRVGVITSLSGAVLHDIVTSFQRRAPHVEVLVYPSLVQGADAPQALTAALARAAAHAWADVLVVCRGGGSIEDLWAFNDERVVRAIAASPIALVSAVGHETDVTLADFAADVRAPTPTAGAELVVTARQESIERLSRLEARMARRMAHAVEGHAQRLDSLGMRLARPTRMVERHAGQLALLERRLGSAAAMRLRHAAQSLDALAVRRAHLQERRLGDLGRRLESMAVRLDAVDPHRVLKRGFAWVTDAGGAAIQSATQVRPGQGLHVEFADGRVAVTAEHGSAPPTQPLDAP